MKKSIKIIIVILIVILILVGVYFGVIYGYKYYQNYKLQKNIKDSEIVYDDKLFSGTITSIDAINIDLNNPEVSNKYELTADVKYFGFDNNVLTEVSSDKIKVGDLVMVYLDDENKVNKIEQLYIPNEQ